MSVQQDFDIPEFLLGDRLRVSLRKIGASGLQAADYFRCDPHTISNWMNNKTRPSGIALKAWALWTGVPLTWLENGYVPDDGGSDLETPR